MTVDRLTDEELAELDSMSEAAEGCDCGCASSRAAFGCADAIPVLLAEVRELRAERVMFARAANIISDVATAFGDEYPARMDQLAEAHRLLLNAIERGEHER